MNVKYSRVQNLARSFRLAPGLFVVKVSTQFHPPTAAVFNSIRTLSSMRLFPFILAWLALVFIWAHLWLGPIRCFDVCVCHRARTWISFEEPKLQNVKLFLQITSLGDPNHQHEFSDPVYQPISAFACVGMGFGLASAVVWLRPRKHRSP